MPERVKLVSIDEEMLGTDIDTDGDYENLKDC
jgi:hypothetical protein